MESSNRYFSKEARKAEIPPPPEQGGHCTEKTPSRLTSAPIPLDKGGSDNQGPLSKCVKESWRILKAGVFSKQMFSLPESEPQSQDQDRSLLIHETWGSVRFPSHRNGSKKLHHTNPAIQSGEGGPLSLLPTASEAG